MSGKIQTHACSHTESNESMHYACVLLRKTGGLVKNMPKKSPKCFIACVKSSYCIIDTIKHSVAKLNVNGKQSEEKQFSSTEVSDELPT